MDLESQTHYLSTPNVYKAALRQNELAYLQMRENVFALRGYNPFTGKLSCKYVIIKRSYNRELNEELYTCSCDEEGDDDDNNDCLHIREISTLYAPYNNYIGDDEESYECEFFTSSLIGIYCKQDSSYSIINHTASETKCLKCKYNVRSCVHVKTFNEFKPEDTEYNVRTQQVFKSLSEELVPYPLDDATDLETYAGYVSGSIRYNTCLIPRYDSSKKCIHGNVFSETLIQSKGKSYLHTKDFTHECVVYHRLAIGCDCRQNYDGRDELLFNLDNIHIFSYQWLYDILHNTQETRYPLHVAYRSARRTRVATGHCYVLTRNDYEKLRQAYNCFLRLLDLDYGDLYECPECGPDVDCIIMDGIMMGCRKDLMPNFEVPQKPDHRIKENNITDRVFIRCTKTKELLASYAGRSKGKYEKQIKPLSISDYEQLCGLLSTNISLLAVILEANNPCPKSIQKLVGELSRDSPTCGILQIAGDTDDVKVIRDVLSQMVNGEILNASRTINGNKKLLKKSCPLILGFLLSEKIEMSNKINLVKDLLVSVDAPFTNRPEHHDHHYGNISESHHKLEFYPNNPLLHGWANYEADKPKEKLDTGCRKDSHIHRTLTPGLFTMLCPHGICIGFQLMDDAESP